MTTFNEMKRIANEYGYNLDYCDGGIAHLKPPFYALLPTIIFQNRRYNPNWIDNIIEFSTLGEVESFLEKEGPYINKEEDYPH